MPDVISTWDNVADGVSCPGEATPAATFWGEGTNACYNCQGFYEAATLYSDAYWPMTDPMVGNGVGTRYYHAGAPRGPYDDGLSNLYQMYFTWSDIGPISGPEKTSITYDKFNYCDDVEAPVPYEHLFYQFSAYFGVPTLQLMINGVFFTGYDSGQDAAWDATHRTHYLLRETSDCVTLDFLNHWTLRDGGGGTIVQSTHNPRIAIFVNSTDLGFNKIGGSGNSGTYITSPHNFDITKPYLITTTIACTSSDPNGTGGSSFDTQDVSTVIFSQPGATTILLTHTANRSNPYSYVTLDLATNQGYLVLNRGGTNTWHMGISYGGDENTHSRLLEGLSTNYEGNICPDSDWPGLLPGVDCPGIAVPTLDTIVAECTPPVEIYRAAGSFRLGFNNERSPYKQDAIIHANPENGTVIAFPQGKGPGYLSASSTPEAWYALSHDYGRTWQNISYRTIAGNWYNNPTHPEWNSSYQFYDHVPGQMCVHPSGKWTMSMIGTGSHGTVYSNDNGLTWKRENPLDRMDNAYGNTYTPTHSGGEDVWMSANDANPASNSAQFIRFDPETQNIYGQYAPGGGNIDETGYNSVYMNGRYFISNGLGNAITEWNGGAGGGGAHISTPMPTGQARRPWALNPSANEFLITELAQPNNGELRYNRVEVGTIPMVAPTITQHIITTPFLDVMSDTAAVAFGDGIYVISAFERENGNRSTLNCVFYYSLDGVEWRAFPEICVMPTTVYNLGGLYNNGRISRLIYCGDSHWIYVYRDSSNYYRFMDFNVYVNAPPEISVWDGLADGVNCPGEATPTADSWVDTPDGANCPTEPVNASAWVDIWIGANCPDAAPGYECDAYLSAATASTEVTHLWPMNPNEGLLDSSKGGITIANSGLGRLGTISTWNGLPEGEGGTGYLPCEINGQLAAGWREDNLGWGSNALFPAGMHFYDSASMSCMSRGKGDEGVGVTFGGREAGVAPWGSQTIKGAAGNIADGFIAFTTGSAANGITGCGLGHYIPNQGVEGPLWQPDWVQEYFNLQTPVAGNQEIFFFACGFSQGIGWVRINDEVFTSTWEVLDASLYNGFDQSSFWIDHYLNPFNGNTIWNIAFGDSHWGLNVHDDLYAAYLRQWVEYTP